MSVLDAPADLTKTLKQVVESNELYRLCFPVLIAHTEAQFAVVVPEEFAAELNLKYEINYVTDQPKLFYMAKARKLGVRPGKKHTTKSSFGDFRLLQFASFPDQPGSPAHFGRTAATLSVKHSGDCVIEVEGEFAKQRFNKRGPNTVPSTRTPNPDPIPQGIPPEVLDKVDAAVVEDLKGMISNKKVPVQRKKSPLRQHLDSPTKVLPETDAVGINKETVRLAVATLNQYLRENRNAEVTLSEVDAPYHEPSDTESVQKVKLEITEIFE